MIQIFKNLRDQINTKRKLRKKEAPIITYQMGKVGSKSIHMSLKNIDAGPLFHIHSIRHDSIHVYSRMLFKYINIERGRAKFITLVREPISRNLSSYFQTIQLFTGNTFDPNSYDVSELIKIYFDKYHHVYPLYWFDYEFRILTGINVYDYNFLDKNHINISEGPFDILVLKTETNDEYKEELVNKFLERDDFKLERINVSSDKNYSKAYSEIQNKIEFSKHYIQEMYDSKYMKHFYSDNEIEKFKNKWAIVE